jgi:endonuclease/exonuclease/phosphatase family metal-dependent hydrolase
VRVVAANLTSGTNQKWDPGHGIRILQGIQGDVLLVQEMNYLSNSTVNLRSFVDQVCGVECDYVRGPTVAGGIPNGVVSRFPILESGSIVDQSTTNRTFVWARIDVPGALDLWAFSVHLLTSGAASRDAEAAQLIDEIAAMVPDEDLLVMGGDFNTDNRTEAALVTLSASFVTGAPYPADQAANENTSGPRTKPYDWVLVDSDLDGRAIPVQIGSNLFPNGLVVDTRVYTPITDLVPALATDSGATNMQHMAVVRDFATE